MSGSTSIKISFLNTFEISRERFAGDNGKQEMSTPDLQHLLGREMLFHLIDLPAGAAVNIGSFGKPFIAHSPCFNLSHTRNAIVCASSSNGEIGIDIEFNRPLDWTQYQDSFSTSDWRIIHSSNDPSIKLLELWTKKESLLKADGRGLQVSLSSVVLKDSLGWIALENKIWHITSVFIEGFSCHLSTEFPVHTIAIQPVQYRSGKIERV